MTEEKPYRLFVHEIDRSKGSTLSIVDADIRYVNEGDSIDMTNKRVTNLARGINSNDAVNVGQLAEVTSGAMVVGMKRGRLRFNRNKCAILIKKQNRIYSFCLMISIPILGHHPISSPSKISMNSTIIQKPFIELNQFFIYKSVKTRTRNPENVTVLFYNNCIYLFYYLYTQNSVVTEDTITDEEFNWINLLTEVLGDD